MHAYTYPIHENGCKCLFLTQCSLILRLRTDTEFETLWDNKCTLLLKVKSYYLLII